MALLRSKDNPEARMSLGEHLSEFRNRALVAALAVVACSVVGWLVYPEFSFLGTRYEGVWNYLTQPLREFADAHHRSSVATNFNQPTQAFTIRLKLALFVGVILASPVWLWQVWAFLAPGLKKQEKRVAQAFVGTAVPLFVGGCVVGSFTINTILGVLYELTPDRATNIIDASNYFDFVTKFILVFGLSFLLPVFLVALNMIRVLPGRRMLSGWRYAVLAIAVFSAAMSPSPDFWSMFALMGPMIVLYFIACGVSILLDRRRERNDPTPDFSGLSDDQASPL